MNKTPVTCIDANMGYNAGGQAEKYQVTWLHAGLINWLGVVKLCTCGTRYVEACLAVGVVHQPAAIKSTRTCATVMIGYAQQAGGNIESSMRAWLVPVFC